MIGKLLRKQQNADARVSRQMRSMKRNRSMTEVPFEWQIKQTSNAVLFRSYGWVPDEAIRWRKPDGTVVPWSCGRKGDTLLIATEFLASR